MMDACGHVKFLKSYSREPYRPPVLRDPHGPIPFVILAHGRTGSSLLVELLRQQPRVRCEGEALQVQHAPARWPLNWTRAERRQPEQLH